MLEPTHARLRIDFEDRALELGEPLRLVVARSIDDVVPALREVERAAAAGRYAAGFVTYEAAPAFDAALGVRQPGALPLLCFAICDVAHVRLAGRDPRVEHLAGTGRRPPPDVPVHGALRPDTTAAKHGAAVATIRAAIARGDVYQVNYTMRLGARATYDASWYARVRDAHRSEAATAGAWRAGHAYFADLDFGTFRIVSLSPELFFRVRGREIVTRPMKGTARRGRWREEDDAARARLAASEKDRAENLMIVDLMRNDLGRIARFGSVHVPRLFEIERYPTVHQMTSTIAATLHERADLVAIFRALFPCGSVTGAPKIAATRLIAALETAPRGAYCGAIGLVEPGGDCTFNVAIRTLTLDVATGTASYGVGGGVTWDSSPAGEYDEAHAKADVLRRAWPAFELLETMRLEAGRYARLGAHLDRLAASAAYFGRPLAAERVRDALDTFASGRHGAWRVRLLVAADGAPRVEGVPVPARPDRGLDVRLVLDAVDSADVFLYHKTTERAVYDAARRRHADADEVLLVNERGEVTELATGNFVVELAGTLVTPPRTSGLLAGVFRDALLAAGRIVERTVRPADLRQASRCWLINSVREWVPIARVVAPGGEASFEHASGSHARMR
jgi:para-aminobenzoate synthetase / 4-amino-4-deoxychorismate lyase